MLPSQARSFGTRFSSIYGKTSGIKDPKVAQFIIGTDNGFLPRQVKQFEPFI